MGCVWQQKEQVEVGAWVELAAAVTTLGNQGDFRGGALLALDGGLEHELEHGIDQGCAGGGNFQPSGAVAMAIEDVFFLVFDEVHDQRGAFAGSDLPVADRFELALGGLLEV